MFEFLVRNIIRLIITVVGAMVLLFLLIHLMPGDPAIMMLGDRATPSLIQRYNEFMWLDRPIHIQLGRFLSNVMRGDFGTDILSHVPISSLIWNVLPQTIALACSSILLALVLGIPLGAYAAAYRNSLLDRILGFVTISIITTPVFLFGLFSLLIFSVYLGWFPLMGGGRQGDLLNQLWHLVLPAFALGIRWVGYFSRIMRASILEILQEDYIRTMRAKGLPERIVIYKHAIRGALLPIVSLIAVGFGNLLGGAVLIEITFHRPGLGYLVYNAIRARNYPVLQAGVIVAVFLYALANMIADMSAGFIDPRVRQNQKD